MYRVIGKSPYLTPASEKAADIFLGVSIGDAIIGLALRHIPDGVYIENCGTRYVTTCGVLVPARDDAEMVTTKNPNPKPDFTRRDYAEWLKDAVQNDTAVLFGGKRWVQNQQS